jgi:hypothetical protein
MARIIEVNIPDEYKDKNKFEIYSHLEKVSEYAHHLKQLTQDLNAELKPGQTREKLLRADILKLKSLVGHKNIEINNLKLESEVEDVPHEVVVDKVQPYLPASVKFHEVDGKITKNPIEKK